MASPKQKQTWLRPVALLGGTAVVVFVLPFLLDWILWTPLQGADKPDLVHRFFAFDPDTAQNALGNLAQVIAAVLGIVITVVSIVVQLAATRYTPRVADMFFRDRINLAALGFYVVAGIDAVWVSLSVARDFVPHISITASLLLVTFSVLITVPYFGYVFDFLDPERVVARIQQQALAAALARDGEASQRAADELEARQLRVLNAVEQLTDVAMNAVGQNDKLIAQGSVDALKELAVRYLGGKRAAPAPWFRIGARLRQTPDFVSMARGSVDQLEGQGVWLEFEVLRQFQALFSESLTELPDTINLIAIDTRYVGEAAVEAGDRHALGLTVKFLNTYLRSSINRRQVRAAYNVLNQYRMLAERVMAAGARVDGGDALLVEIAGYFRYYALLGVGMQLGFVAETAAYDVAALCERAFEARSGCHEGLLKVLLTIDREAEGGVEERALRGVRKAQLKLATFYLERGAEAEARLIAADLRDEKAGRLRSIRDELLAVQTSDFWEVVDRGGNFDYLDGARKDRLIEFLSWLPQMSTETAAAATGPIAVSAAAAHGPNGG
jgi:hypothetical protein